MYADHKDEQLRETQKNISPEAPVSFLYLNTFIHFWILRVYDVLQIGFRVVTQYKGITFNITVIFHRIFYIAALIITET